MGRFLRYKSCFTQAWIECSMKRLRVSAVVSTTKLSIIFVRQNGMENSVLLKSYGSVQFHFWRTFLRHVSSISWGNVKTFCQKNKRRNTDSTWIFFVFNFEPQIDSHENLFFVLQSQMFEIRLTCRLWSQRLNCQFFGNT